MLPTARNPSGSENESPEITPTELFAVFAHERRQYALTYLAQQPAAIPLGDLAEYIAIKEGHRNHEWYERICTDLYHSHLPTMSDLGLIHYDADTELIELAATRDVVDPYLELAQIDT